MQTHPESGVFCITPEEDSVINISSEESCILISSDTEDVGVDNNDVICLSLDDQGMEIL